MTLRHTALAVASVLVLGLGVYLFIEVRARPASAQVQPKGKTAVAGDSTTDDRSRPGRSIRRDEPAPVLGNPDQPDEKPTRVVGGRPMDGPGGFLRERPGKEPDIKLVDPNAVPQHKLDAVMDEVNKAYDKGELDDARAMAQKVLAKQPGNARMLRVVVSASCISGDKDEAQKAYLQLSKTDRTAMRTRCARYDMTFKED